MLSRVIDVLYGFMICWLLNLVHLAIAFLLLASSDRLMAYAYVLTAGIGLLQIGYVVPIYRLLSRKGKPYVARGLLAAALITAIANFAIDSHLVRSHGFPNAQRVPEKIKTPENSSAPGIALT